MSADRTAPPSTHRADYLLLGAALAVASIPLGIWEILASQIPASPYNVSVLPAPVAQLRATVWWLAIAAFLASSIRPQIRLPRLLFVATCIGTAILLAAGLYGALHGMIGVQILDPRPTAQGLFAVRSLGQLILSGCLLEILRRIVPISRRSQARLPTGATRPEAIASKAKTSSTEITVMSEPQKSTGEIPQ